MKDFIIIGSGQSGLAMAYYLNKQNASYLIVDANKEVGDTWLKRWDSLRLFTPSEYNNLPGMDFPCPKGHYADKYQVADYLKTYVKRFNIPIEFNQKITNLKKEDGVFILKSEATEYKAKNVIIATGPFHTPFTPKFHSKISTDIIQIHSENYKNTRQLKEGLTVVVGAGDSGVQILNEVSSDINRQVYFSGNTDITTIPQEFLGKSLWWWFDKIGILRVNKYSRIGKWLNTTIQPIIGTDVKEIFSRPNVNCVGRFLDANENNLVFKIDSFKNVKNIIWATGFKPNFDWIEDVELDEKNYPKNYRGVSENIEGLYFIGLPWQYTRGSATLGGLKSDAEYLNKHIFRK